MVTRGRVGRGRGRGPPRGSGLLCRGFLPGGRAGGSICTASQEPILFCIVGWTFFATLPLLFSFLVLSTAQFFLFCGRVSRKGALTPFLPPDGDVQVDDEDDGRQGDVDMEKLKRRRMKNVLLLLMRKGLMML